MHISFSGAFPHCAAANGDSLAIVVLGASGDLAKKKTFAALYELFLAGLLPKGTTIWGYARSEMTDDKFVVGILGEFGVVFILGGRV